MVSPDFRLLNGPPRAWTREASFGAIVSEADVKRLISPARYVPLQAAQPP
jgi:hypothetical protein